MSLSSCGVQSESVTMISFFFSGRAAPIVPEQSRAPQLPKDCKKNLLRDCIKPEIVAITNELHSAKPQGTMPASCPASDRNGGSQAQKEVQLSLQHEENLVNNKLVQSLPPPKNFFRQTRRSDGQDPLNSRVDQSSPHDDTANQVVYLSMDDLVLEALMDPRNFVFDLLLVPDSRCTSCAEIE
jgi:hypothetical protein